MNSWNLELEEIVELNPIPSFYRRGNREPEKSHVSSRVPESRI
jgi:hypothetical protein